METLTWIACCGVAGVRVEYTNSIDGTMKSQRSAQKTVVIVRRVKEAEAQRGSSLKLALLAKNGPDQEQRRAKTYQRSEDILTNVKVQQLLLTSVEDRRERRFWPNGMQVLDSNGLIVTRGGDDWRG